MVCRRLVHVAGGVEVALRVVEGAVGDAFCGVCAVSGFAEVLCAAVDAAERGFDGALVCVGCAGVGGVGCFVPFVVYEAGAVAFDADGDGRGVDVAEVFGEVDLLLVGETVPRVGERVDGRRANALVVARLVGAGLCVVVAGVPPPLGFSLLCCLVFVALLVFFFVARAVCARGAVAHCVYV